MSDLPSNLHTVSDFVRFAASEFERGGLVYGHGTNNALDEAAFLIAETLGVAPERFDPFSEAALSQDQRRALSACISARVETRKPAPYLVRRAYIQGAPFYVDERVITPRSYIGELLGDDLFAPGGALIGGASDVRNILDLCTGSGCLAILAALRFPEAKVDAVDVSADALDVAARNVGDYELGDRVRLLKGNLFAPVDDKKYDLIIANPPYVDADAMAALPPEYMAEPALALAGGADGLDIVRAIVEQAPDHLVPHGGLVCEIGRGRTRLEAAYPALPFLWLDTEESEGEVFWLSAADFTRAR